MSIYEQHLYGEGDDSKFRAAAKRYLEQAAEQGLASLKGHRSVGGCRASIYNAMPVEGVEALRDFMLDFCKNNK